MSFKRTLIIGLLATAGCDLVESAQAVIVVGGAVVKSPAISVMGQLDLPAEVVASGWVGERDSPTSTDAPQPISDATVRLTFAGNRISLPLADAERGLYATTSVMDTNLEYVAGVAYAIEADTLGTTAGGALMAAPTELTPAALTLSPRPTDLHPTVREALVHPRNGALQISWTEQYGRYGYVTVLRANRSAPDQPEVVFDTRPITAQEVLDLVLNPETSVDVPGEVFAADGFYAVVVVAVEKGDDLLPNTFLGSALLVGSSAAVILAVDAS